MRPPGPREYAAPVRREADMADPLIKSVNRTPRVQDALKKPDPEKKKKPRKPPRSRKKDSKRIIDTYA